MAHQMKVAFGVLINDYELFYKNFSREGIKTIGVFDPTSAASGLNYILKEMESTECAIGVLTHQDVVVSEEWIPSMLQRIEELPNNWLVAGLWGATKAGDAQNFFGNVIDARVARKVGSAKPVGIYAGPLPTQVDCLDEVCLIVNLKHGFRFDESYRGFDLYGSYICLWAKQNGLSAWAIDAPVTHETKRSWAWKPDQTMLKNWDKLEKDFPNLPVVSTVFY